MRFTRRDFMKSAGALSALTVAPPIWLRAQAASALEMCETDTRNIIIVQLEGGNDGTNMVIPQSGGFRSTYETQRPIIGVDAADLTGTLLGADPGSAGSTLALHPHMPALKALHDSGNLATLLGVHYPDRDLSHFDSERIWYFADPTRSNGTGGWMGQTIASLCAGQPSAVPAVDVERRLTPLFNGTTQVLTASSINSFEFPLISRFSDEEDVLYRAAFDSIYDSILQGPPGLQQAFSASLLAGLSKIDSWQAVDSDVALNLNDLLDGTANGTGGFGLGGVGFSSSLARDLRTVFAIMRGGPPGVPLGPRIFRVAMGGFDTHNNQGIHDPVKTIEAKRQDQFNDEFHANRLYNLDQSIGAFWQDCIEAGFASNTCIMTFSEFARRIDDNNEDERAGTDHGTAGPMFIVGPTAAEAAGPSVNGGLYGTYPDMDNPDDDNNYQFDPVTSIDFRNMYAEIMTRWLDLDVAETESILHGFSYTPLDFLQL